MPNVNAVLNDQIRRLARREIRANTKTIKKATGHYRRDIAGLKRHVAQLLKDMSALQKRLPSGPTVPAPESLQNARLRIDGLKAHRTRLGLSAKDYGSLLGVSSLTVYNWENGKSKPRRSQLPAIVAVRGIGKREAMHRLGLGKTTATIAPTDSAKGPSRRRGKFKQTGEQLILSLLQRKESLATRQINEAWLKAGRGGTADVLLGKMVKDRKIKRTKIKGERSARYSTA